MASISVGAAIGAGYGLVRRQPLTVLAWGVLPTLLQFVTLALLAPVYLALYGGMFASIAAGGPATPPSGLSPQVLQFQGLAPLGARLPGPQGRHVRGVRLSGAGRLPERPRGGHVDR
ncbi:MAG TPA: hypothetical protein VMT68_20780 [Caulobacteraceae bacterium]|nr:hypothetical protein [Caulobacteraceae bacterium]